MPPPRCSDYRADMQLVELKRRLQSEKLSETQKTELRREIERLERQLGLD